VEILDDNDSGADVRDLADNTPEGIDHTERRLLRACTVNFGTVGFGIGTFGTGTFDTVNPAAADFRTEDGGEDQLVWVIDIEATSGTVEPIAQGKQVWLKGEVEHVVACAVKNIRSHIEHPMRELGDQGCLANPRLTDEEMHSSSRSAATPVGGQRLQFCLTAHEHSRPIPEPERRSDIGW